MPQTMRRHQCGAHLRFAGLEPAVGLRPALWTVDYTSPILTRRYLHRLLDRYQIILLGDRGTWV